MQPQKHKEPGMISVSERAYVRLIVRGKAADLEACREMLVKAGYYITDEASDSEGFLLAGDKSGSVYRYTTTGSLREPKVELEDGRII